MTLFDRSAEREAEARKPFDMAARFCQGPHGQCGLPAVVVCSARETPDAPEDPRVRDMIQAAARARELAAIWPRDKNDDMEWGPVQWYACSNPEHQGLADGAHTMLLVDWFDLVRQWKERRELEDRQIAAAEVLDADLESRPRGATRIGSPTRASGTR